MRVLQNYSTEPTHNSPNLTKTCNQNDIKKQQFIINQI